MYRLHPALSHGYARSRRRRRWTVLLIESCLLVASLAIGRAVVETQSIEPDPLEIALAMAGGLAAVAVMLAGPVGCLAAVAALTVLHLFPDVAVGSGVELTLADAFVGALFCWRAIRAAGLSCDRAPSDQRPRPG